MKTRDDYETDPTLAVFGSPDQAEVAIGRLRALGLPGDAIRQTRLAHGSYQCIDPSLGEGFAGVLRGVQLGAPAGSALGLGIAVSISRTGPDVFAGLAVVGALVGALVGSMVGAAVRAHYDDDVAQAIDVPDGSSAVLLLAETHSDGTTGRVRQVLRRAGALAFLDPTMYAAFESARPVWE
jgi:hypothetical protein